MLLLKHIKTCVGSICQTIICLPVLCGVAAVIIWGVVFIAIEDGDIEECEVVFRPSLISMLRKVFILNLGSHSVSWDPEDAFPSGVCSSSVPLHACMTFSVQLCEPPTAVSDWLEKSLGWTSTFLVTFLSFFGIEEEERDKVSWDLSADNVDAADVFIEGKEPYIHRRFCKHTHPVTERICTNDRLRKRRL